MAQPKIASWRNARNQLRPRQRPLWVRTDITALQIISAILPKAGIDQHVSGHGKNAIIASSDKANANARPSAYLTARRTPSCLCIDVFPSARRRKGCPRAAPVGNQKIFRGVTVLGPCKTSGVSRGIADASAGPGTSFARWGRFTLSRCARGHKLDIQTYEGRVIPQIATLHERAA